MLAALTWFSRKNLPKPLTYDILSTRVYKKDQLSLGKYVWQNCRLFKLLDTQSLASLAI